MNIQLITTYLTGGAVVFLKSVIHGTSIFAFRKERRNSGFWERSPIHISLILLGKMQEERNVVKARATLLPISNSLKQSMVATAFFLL